MPPSLQDQGNIRFTPEAKTLLKDNTSRFGEMLSGHCQTLARREGDNVVTPKHVHEGYKFLVRGNRSHRFFAEFSGNIGGVLAGIGVSWLFIVLNWEGEIPPLHIIGCVAFIVIGLVFMAFHAMAKV